MRHIALVILTVTALVGCVSHEETQIKAAQDIARSILRDPDSAKFECKWSEGERSNSQKERYTASGPILECSVRAKNGFGGYGSPMSFDFMFYSDSLESGRVLSAYYFSEDADFAGRWVRIK